MNDEAHNEILDAEFRQILYIIKPLISNINDHYNLERYRIWLERLSSVYPSEKLERNKYLLELANQIHDNVLKPPFTVNPLKGLLPTLSTFQNRVSLAEDPARISEHFFQNKPEVEWPYLTPRLSSSHGVNTIRRCVSARESTSSYEKKKTAKIKTTQPFQALGKSDMGTIKSESTSWCDLTDATDVEDDKKSVSKLHKEEGWKVKEHFAKKNSQVFVPVDTKSSKECKPNKEQSRKKSDQVLQKSSHYFDVAELPEIKSRGRKPTEQEVEALKMRMKDLLEMKNALRDTHCLTEDRKKTIEFLQGTVKELKRENVELRTCLEAYENKKKIKVTQVELEKAELQTLLEAQQKKLMEMEHVKSKEMAAFKEKFTLLRQKESEFLKQYHKNEINTLTQQHADEITELQTKIKSLEKEYEVRVKHIAESNLSLLKQKDHQIQKLRSELKLRSNQPHTGEGGGEQVVDLKRCISQLEKVLHKSDNEYGKKIEKLKQELEMKEIKTQVQLQAQKANLILNNSTTKQDEVASALNSLEAKYRRMVEYTQKYAQESKKQDEQTIDDLRNLLKKHNIQC